LSAEDIVESFRYIEELESKYGKLKRVMGVMGRWFSKRRKVFFDCEEEDKSRCLEGLFESRDIDALTVYYVVRGPNGYQLRDVRFKNIYGQTLDRFVNHYHLVLEPSMRYSLKIGGFEYVECIGYGCSIKVRAKRTISNISEIKRVVEEETGLNYILIEEAASGVKVLNVSGGGGRVPVEKIVVSKESVTLYAPRDLSIEKPEEKAGPEFEKYLRNVAWKDAMALTLREKYYGILVTFDPDTTGFRVELNYPVDEERLRKACHALEESGSIE